MPYESHGRQAAQAVTRALVGITAATFGGLVFKEAGVLLPQDAIDAINGGAPYLMGIKLEMLYKSAFNHSKLTRIETAAKLGVDKDQLDQTIQNMNELRQLANLDPVQFHKKFDRALGRDDDPNKFDPAKVAKDYNISREVAGVLCDQRHWALQGAETFFMRILIPVAAASAVGWAIPLPAALSGSAFLSGLVRNAVGHTTAEVVRAGWDAGRQSGLLFKSFTSRAPAEADVEHGEDESLLPGNSG